MRTRGNAANDKQQVLWDHLRDHRRCRAGLDGFWCRILDLSSGSNFSSSDEYSAGEFDQDCRARELYHQAQQSAHGVSGKAR